MLPPPTHFTRRVPVATPARSRHDLLPLIPAALLCLVALFQLYLTRTQDLTPWKGGGFGMFSTNDDRFRELEIFVEGPEGERNIELPERAGTEARRVTVMPSERRLRTLARRIAELERAEGAVVTRVRIEVWRTAYSPVSFAPRPELVRQSVVDVE